MFEKCRYNQYFPRPYMKLNIDATVPLNKVKMFPSIPDIVLSKFCIYLADTISPRGLFNGDFHALYFFIKRRLNDNPDDR